MHWMLRCMCINDTFHQQDPVVIKPCASKSTPLKRVKLITSQFVS